MKYKTAELEGARLNEAVAIAEGWTHAGAVGSPEDDGKDRPYCLSGMNDWWKSPEGEWVCGPCYGYPNDYCGAWERGGPIIERERITVAPFDCGLTYRAWGALLWDNAGRGDEYIDSYMDQWDGLGPTPLIAAMRAYVASKYGEEVELP